MDDRERQNLLMMANLCVRESRVSRVRVRNISRGGVKVTAAVAPPVGEPVSIELPNIGWLRGKVAWASGDDCGIQLRSEIDPARVRQPITGAYVHPDQPGLRRVA